MDVKQSTSSPTTADKRQKLDSPDSPVALSDDESSHFIFADGNAKVTLTEAAREAIGQCSETDPAVAVRFNEVFVTAVQTINNLPANQRPNFPAWMPGVAYPITATEVQMCLMNFCAQASGGGVIESFIIAPNTTVEYGKVISRFGGLCGDAFLVAIARIANGPIGGVFMLKETNRTVTAITAGVENMFLPAGTIPAFD